jgi:uncharacterized repeat protein (TIGR03803 family)
VFELSLISGQGWSETVLYAFCPNGPPCPDGVFPAAGLSVDKSGNLYGTANQGGFDGQWGTVYELSPASGGNWTETTLHRFNPQAGGQPFSEVNFDLAGDLYGTVSAGPRGGRAQCGGVWRLTPQPDNVFKANTFLFNQSGANGCDPAAGVFMDSEANTVFGTTSTGGGSNGGTLFKIAGTKQTVLYNFCQQAGCADGSTPSASLTVNGAALYSTTTKGGAFNQGVVFQITH